MNKYHQLIENPLFFKWIYHPSPEINTYWEHYLEEHSDDAQSILEFKSGFEKNFRFDEQALTSNEKQQLANQILKKLDANDKLKIKPKLVSTMLRYAAVAVFFLLIGSGITFFLFEFYKPQPFVEIPPIAKMNLDEPTLIFDNKTEISLTQGKSELLYSSAGELMLNQEKVAIPENAERVRMNTLVIPFGNTSTLTLSDGTRVWLNAGSRMIYPSRFVDNKREVFLVGEAFFQVTKNEKKPFVVRTPDIEVNVLGTQFNISAYSDDNIIQTVLAEGKIELKRATAGFFEQSITVVPGQLATLNKTTQETHLYNVDVDYYIGWKQGYLSFQNSDLSRIIKKLERYYNIHFKYNDPMDGTIKLSGKLDISKDRDQSLELISSLTKLKFIPVSEKTYLIK